LVIILNTEIRSKKALVSCILLFFAFACEFCGMINYYIILKNNKALSINSYENISKLILFKISVFWPYIISIIAILLLIIYSLILFTHSSKKIFLRIAVIIFVLSNMYQLITNIITFISNVQNINENYLLYIIYSFMVSFIDVIIFVLLLFASFNIIKNTRIVSIAIFVKIAEIILLPFVNLFLSYKLLPFHKISFQHYLKYYYLNHSLIISLIIGLLYGIFLYLGLFFLFSKKSKKIEATNITQDSSGLIEDSTEKRIDALNTL